MKKKNIVNGTKLFINETLAIVENGKEKVYKIQWIGVVENNYYTKHLTHYFLVKCICLNYKNKVKLFKNNVYKRQGKSLYKNSVIISQPIDVKKQTKIKLETKKNMKTLLFAEKDKYSIKTI